MKNIPANYQDLLADECKAFLYLATTMSDGTPQVTPVWFNADENHILVNTAAGRVKDINMQERPFIALAIQAPDDPYRYIQIRGKVVGRTTEGADAHINALSLKYRGRSWSGSADETRVIYKISADKVDAH